MTSPNQRDGAAPVGAAEPERVPRGVDLGEHRGGVVEVAHVPGRAEGELVVAKQQERRR